jgi:hypothetical protein
MLGNETWKGCKNPSKRCCTVLSFDNVRSERGNNVIVSTAATSKNNFVDPILPPSPAFIYVKI